MRLTDWAACAVIEWVTSLFDLT